MRPVRASHTIFHHRFYVVGITKYRYKVLTGDLRLRVREIIAQATEVMEIHIVNGVLSSDHVHLFLDKGQNADGSNESMAQSLL